MGGGKGVEEKILDEWQIEKNKARGRASLLIPFGFLNYCEMEKKLPKEHQDQYILKAIKISGNFIYTILCVTYGSLSAITGSLNPSTQIEKLKSNIEKVQNEYSIKKEVINIVDVDNNGLSNTEKYFIDQLMGIEDSSATYVPTEKDWEKAYKKLENRFPPIPWPN